MSTGTGDYDNSTDRIASALGAVADAIHHLAENVWEYRKTSEENTGKLAEAITSIAHGDGHGPGGLEGLTMALVGVGEPGSYPVSSAISGGLGGIADAISEARP